MTGELGGIPNVCERKNGPYNTNSNKDVAIRGFAKLKKFQKSKNNLEVGGWVQVPFG